MENVEKLQQLIDQSDHIVFFGGAGVSTESGIPDFRSKDGLYHMKYQYPPEEILSHHFLEDHPAEFFEFYRNKMNCLEALPNSCHKYLVELEKQGKLLNIITQNIDGLHRKAGSRKILELHGSIYKNHCMKCGKAYSADFIFQSMSLPKCSCGGVVRPDVVLYEEMLDEKVIYDTIQSLKQADLLIVCGTSLTVYPASGFLRYYKGQKIVVINRDQTSYDSLASLVIHDPIGEVFSQLK